MTKFVSEKPLAEYMVFTEPLPSLSEKYKEVLDECKKRAANGDMSLVNVVWEMMGGSRGDCWLPGMVVIEKYHNGTLVRKRGSCAVVTDVDGKMEFSKVY